MITSDFCIFLFILDHTKPRFECRFCKVGKDNRCYEHSLKLKILIMISEDNLFFDLDILYVKIFKLR